MQDNYPVSIGQKNHIPYTVPNKMAKKKKSEFDIQRWYWKKYSNERKWCKHPQSVQEVETPKVLVLTEVVKCPKPG